MAKPEIYPWSLLTEVGDYFCVPADLKPFPYVSQYVTQKNYRLVGQMKYSATKTSYGTIVMLAQIGEETPPYEFNSPEGILSSTSRKHLISSMYDKADQKRLGEKAVVAERTIQQKVNAMSWEVRNANLPWWYDPKKGTLVVNPEVIKEPEATLFYTKQFNPGPDMPYPDHYNLDENLLRRSEAPATEEEEEEWGDQTFPPSGEDEQ